MKVRLKPDLQVTLGYEGLRFLPADSTVAPSVVHLGTLGFTWTFSPREETP